MGNISNQYTRTIDNHGIYYDIERGYSDIENNRIYGYMEKCCPTSRIHVRKYSFTTPEIENIAESQCKEGDHRQKNG